MVGAGGGTTAMTNREKAIEEITSWMKTLDNELLACVIHGNPRIETCCKYCIYDNEAANKCRNTYHDSCQNGIKQWLEQEQE